MGPVLADIGVVFWVRSTPLFVLAFGCIDSATVGDLVTLATFDVLGAAAAWVRATCVSRVEVRLLCTAGDLEVATGFCVVLASIGAADCLGAIVDPLLVEAWLGASLLLTFANVVGCGVCGVPGPRMVVINLVLWALSSASAPSAVALACSASLIFSVLAGWALANLAASLAAVAACWARAARYS